MNLHLTSDRFGICLWLEQPVWSEITQSYHLGISNGLPHQIWHGVASMPMELACIAKTMHTNDIVQLKCDIQDIQRLVR